MEQTDASGDKRPRVLVVLNHYLPDSAGGGELFTDLCESLAARGLHITVRAAVSYYPEWIDKTGQNGLRIGRYHEGGVDVERYGFHIPKTPSSLLHRLLIESSLFLSLARSLFRRERYDVVLAFCPFAACVAYGAVHRLLHKTPLWVNVQDIPVAAAAAGGIVRGGGARRLLAGVENRLFNAGDIWSSVAPGMVRDLETMRTRNQPVLHLPNWLHASLAKHIASSRDASGSTPGPTPRLLYSGNIGRKQDLLRLCKLLHGADDAFEFAIHGAGAEADKVRDWLASVDDTRFSMRPLSDEAGFAKALHDADYFVISERPGSGNSYMPSKLLAGVAAETPILTISDPGSPLGVAVRSNDLGPWKSWDEVEAAPEAIVPSADAATRYGEWRDNYREYSASLGREQVIGRFEQALRVLADSTTTLDERIAAIRALD